ncbi:MAG: response regulator [Anaerolineae bacterium]
MSDMLPENTRILVIDDDPDLLVLLSKMLSRIGAPPETAQNGTDGLALLSQEPFDLLILDLMLPDMDGFDVLEQVRSNETLADMPVLILSALADPNTINKGYEMGADGYLTKPYLPNTLTSRVRAVLSQGRRK